MVVNRSPDIAPLVTLDESKKLYLLELFCGPTFAFKDVALQFLGNLFEYFLIRKNEVRDPPINGPFPSERHNLWLIVVILF